VPTYTKSLIITDGTISLINVSSFSDLTHLSHLTLIKSKISRIDENALNNLTKLRTLVLDSNQISDSSINAKTFYCLYNLEILKLNNNALISIYGSWFKGNKNLLRLELNSNRITKLTYDSFSTKSLGHLRHLDLSINFIGFIDKYAFQALHQLRELDLSKNKLTTIPDIFSFLSQLIRLNLHQNQWNCTCELQDLSDFLRNYTSSAIRILGNRNNLPCSYSSNPAVHTVLQLTGRNCLSSPYNITLILKDKSKTFSPADFLLIVVLCLTGTIALSCLITGILLYKLQLKKASGDTSRVCSNGAVQEIHCVHCTLNNCPKQPCKISLNKESDTDVMSVKNELGKKTATFLYDRDAIQTRFYPNASNISFRVKSEEKLKSVKGSYFICLDCRLIQNGPPSLPSSLGNVFETNEVEGLTNRTERIVTNPRDFRIAAHWQDIQGTVLKEMSKLNRGFIGQTCDKRYSIPESSVLERKYSQVSPPHFNAYNSLQEKEKIMIGSQKHEIHDIGSSVTNNSEKMKIPAGKYPLYIHQSQRGGHSILVGERKNIYLQPNNYLICKYLDCDKLEGCGRQIAGEQLQNVKFEEKKIQTDDTKENCFLNDDNVLLSARIKRMNIPRTVSFYIPNIVHDPNTALITSDSHKEQSFRKCPGNKYLFRTNTRDKGSGKTDVLLDALKDVKRKGPEGSTENTRNRQDCLMVKMNLKPFGKVRIHPQKIDASSNESTKRRSSQKHKPLQVHREEIKSNHVFGSKSEKEAAGQGKSISETQHSSSRTCHSEIITDDMNQAPNCTSLPKIIASEKKSKEKVNKGFPLTNDSANENSTHVTTTLLTEENDNVSLVQPSILQSIQQSAVQDTSVSQGSNLFAKQAALNTVVECEGQISADQCQKYDEPRDSEKQGMLEELTDCKPPKQYERKDKCNTLQGNVHNTTLSNVSGVTVETDFQSLADSIVGETLTSADLATSNPRIPGAEHKYKGDNDNGVQGSLANGSPASMPAASILDNMQCPDLKVVNTIRFADCKDEYIHFQLNMIAVSETIEQSPNNAEMLSIDLSPSSGNDHVQISDETEQIYSIQHVSTKEPNLNEESKELKEIHPQAENEAVITDSQESGALNFNPNLLLLPATVEQVNASAVKAPNIEKNNSYEKLGAENPDHAEVLPMTPLQGFTCSSETIEISQNRNLDLPFNTDENVPTANESIAQEADENQLDEININRQQASTITVNKANMTFESQELNGTQTKTANKVFSIQSQVNDDLDLPPKSTQLSMTDHEEASP
ncbi:hypothetical protein GDO86_008027, partial [Hymenochirus boettgeri]